MKRFLFVAISALSISGCASTSERQAATQPSFDYDYDTISAVEHQARLLGVRVIWVNAPRKVAGSAGT